MGYVKMPFREYNLLLYSAAIKLLNRAGTKEWLSVIRLFRTLQPSRMHCVVNLFQLPNRDARIDLNGLYAGVTKHSLNEANVGTRF